MSTVIYADGAAKNNADPLNRRASAAAVVVSEGRVFNTYAVKLGNETNNVAEYHGLLLALRAAREMEMAIPVIRMDSNLVVQQFLGNWKCKDRALQALLRKAQAMAAGFVRVDIAWIPREENTLADQAGNDVLDGTIPQEAPDWDLLAEVEEITLFTEPSLPEKVNVTRADLLDLLLEVRMAGQSNEAYVLDKFLMRKSVQKPSGEAA